MNIEWSEKMGDFTPMLTSLMAIKNGNNSHDSWNTRSKIIFPGTQ